MFVEDVFKEGGNTVTKDDRIGDLHHGCFHVKRKENTLVLSVRNLFLEECQQRLFTHVSSVDDFTCEQWGALLENGGGAISRGMFNADIGRVFNGD